MKSEIIQKVIDTIHDGMAEVKDTCEGEGQYTQYGYLECKQWADYLTHRLLLLKKHFENKEKMEVGE